MKMALQNCMDKSVCLEATVKHNQDYKAFYDYIKNKADVIVQPLLLFARKESAQILEDSIGQDFTKSAAIGDGFQERLDEFQAAYFRQRKTGLLLR